MFTIMNRSRAAALRLVVMTAALAGLVYVSPARAQFDALRNFGKSAAPAKKIPYFRLKGALVETPTNLPPLFGNEPPMSLKQLLERLKEARLDNDVVAVVLDVQDAALGMAQLEELHASISKFAAVDKDVFVHADSLTTGTYALATSASRISIVPTGDLWLLGLFGETPYLRGALDKLGIVPDFMHCGDFKTGAEPITRTGPSAESEEMMGWLLDGIYRSVVELIADARGMSPDDVIALINDGPYTAERALEKGLIDAVEHRQDFIELIEQRYGESAKVVKDYGKDEDMDIPQDFFGLVQMFMQMINPTPKTYTEPSVAVIYVEGAIATGEAEPSPFGGASGAFSTTIRRALDKAAEDDSVKAVVMRVDSPGGSALASEIILDASMRVADKKPLIVSMGNVAGSGGYYVSCGAETIFADKSTITASIGVLSGKLVTTDAWKKIGINWHSIQRGDMAAMMSSASQFTDRERAKMRHYMNEVYGIFKGHVVEARGDRLSKPIDELAGGRVFTGAQALERGLVDKLGGLTDAIKFAGKRAGISEYEIRVIPEPPSILDLFMGDRDDDAGFTRVHSTKRLSLIDAPVFAATLPVITKLDPLRAQAMIRALRKLELIHDEGVVMMMPAEFVIH